jgi:heptosyltransferase-3
MIKQPMHGHWRRLWLQTIGTSWDLVVDLRNTAVSRMLRKRTLKVFRGLKPRQHMVEGLAELVGVDSNEASPRLWLSSGLLEQVGRERRGAERLLALAPGAHGFGKRWPADRYAALAKSLLEPGGILAGGKLVVLGGPMRARKPRHPSPRCRRTG